MRTGNRAFTVAELLIGLVVGAIVVLMIGAMATIAAKSYRDLQNRSALDSDSQFAIDAIRSAVRQSASIPTASGSTLTIDANHSFSLSGGDLSYVTASPASTQRVLSKLSALSFTASTSGTPANLVTVVLNYTKAGVAYSYSFMATRRNP